MAEVVQQSTASNPAPPPANGRVKSGLRCEWWFDEPTGSIVYDKSLGTTPTDLSVVGGERLQDPNYNDRYYLELSSGGSAVNLNPIELIDIANTANGVTVEAWVRPTAAAGANPGPGRIISYSHPTAGATNAQNFMLGHGTWTGAGYDATNYHGRGVVGDTDISNGVLANFTGNGTAKAELQHVVMTLKRDQNHANGDVYVQDIFVDGVLAVSEDTPFETTPVFEGWTTTYDLIIGNETGTTRRFDGGIYLVAIYDKALTAGEVQQNFTEGVVSITNAYQAGSQLYIQALDGSVVPISGTFDFTVIPSGTRVSPINVTVDASSPSGTYGVDFTIVDKTKTIAPGEYEKTFTLVNLNDNELGDIPVTFYIKSATGSNVIQPVGQNIDEVDVDLRSSRVIPEVKFIGPGTPPNYTIQAGTTATQEVFAVNLDRKYWKDIDVTVSTIEVNDPSCTYTYDDGTVIPGSYVVTIPAGSFTSFISLSSGDSDGYGIWADGGSVKSILTDAIGADGSTISIGTLSTAQANIYNQDIGAVVEPTSANTGYRLDLTALQPADTVYASYYTNGKFDFTDSNVPDTGVVVSGVYFHKELTIRTDKPIKFVDCYFSAAPTLLENWNNNHVVYFVHNGPNNDIEYRYGENLEFEYCSFYGCVKSIHLNTRFKSLYRCFFDWCIADFIRCKSSDYILIEECFFGPRVNIENTQWTMADVGPILATTPHADVWQIYQSEIEWVHFLHCTFTRARHNYVDGTTNPNSLGIGGGSDKIVQLTGSLTKLDKLTYEGCWIYGGHNTWSMIWSSQPNKQNPAWTAFTYEYINNKIGGSGMRAYTGITGSHPNTTRNVQGNVWLQYGVETVRLPQEAIDAGSLTNNGSEYLNVNDLLNGNDWLRVDVPGLNEGGKPEWIQRATPQ